MIESAATIGSVVFVTPPPAPATTTTTITTTKMPPTKLQIDNIDPKIEELLDILRDDGCNRTELVLGMNKLIPTIIMKSFESKDELADHLLLLLYNLNSKMDTKYDTINHTNRALIIKKLLRHYTDHVEDPDADQLRTLTKMISYVSHLPELLIELAQVFNHFREIDSETSRKALSEIRDIAAVNLYSDALLMVYSIEPVV